MSSLESRQKEILDFIESANVGLHWVGADGIILWANQAEMHLLGYTRDEYVGHSIAEFHADQPVIDDILARLARNEVLCNREARLVHKDRSIRHVLINSSVLRDEQGNFIHTRCFTNDITELKRAEQRLKTEHGVARALAESTSLPEALPRILEAICESTGWQWAALWTPDDEKQFLGCMEICHPAAAYPEFEELSRRTRLTSGVGLPGRVWASRQPAWISDVTHDDNFPRGAAAARAGLHGAACFPLMVAGDVVGVMEFFSTALRPPDEHLLAMMLVIGAQIGQYIDRRQAERLLQGSQIRNASIMATALDSIVSMDHRGRVTEWNPAAERTFGFTREEAVGSDMAELIIPPSLRERHRQGLKHFLKTGEGPVIGNRIEIIGRRKNGEEFPVELAVTPVPLPGLPTFIGYLRDITERKQIEASLHESAERLRLGLDAGKTGIWDWDIVRNTVTWSDRVYEFHGVNPGEFGGKVEEFTRLVHIDDLPMVESAIQHSLTTGDAYQVEFRVARADGTVRWLNTIGRVYFDEARKPVRMLGATSDITERKLAEEERDHLLASERVARSEAERAGRLKDEFLATLSHELRTPLNAILGYSQLLRGGASSPADIAESLEVIERNARVQAQIIEDLLDMSRIVSGKIRLDVQPVDLPRVIRAAIDTVRHAAEAKAIRLNSVIDPFAGPVSADPARLQQVIWNLLSNAIKFTPKGGKVQIVLQRVNSHLEIAVSDSGQGISVEFLPYVFDKFRQADASASRRHGGLGLGLSIAKNLVELHGGSIRATSAGENQGATFVIHLPLSAVHTDADPADRRHPSSPTHAADHDRPSLKGISVLVVDDEPDATRMVRRILEECGASVLTADSAQQALELLESNAFHVLLSDIGMPKVDGYDLIRRIRARPPSRQGQLPAAALTAFARSEDRTRAMMAGFQTHIAKPVEAAELIAAVTTLAQRTVQT